MKSGVEVTTATTIRNAGGSMTRRLTRGLLLPLAVMISIARLGSPVPVVKAQTLAADEVTPRETGLSFIPNTGQLVDPAVRFYSTGGLFGAHLMPGEIAVSFPMEETHPETGASEVLTAASSARQQRSESSSVGVLRLAFIDSSAEVTIEGARPANARVNYLYGPDPTAWRTGIRPFAEVVYRGLWPGIDLAVDGNGSGLKYELTIHPGARLADARIRYDGARTLRVDDNGDLIIDTGGRVVRETIAESFQLVDGQRVPLDVQFTVEGPGVVTFEVGPDYNPTFPLVIDPDLVFATLLGGIGQAVQGETGHGVAVDGAGNVYVTGETRNVDFPISSGAVDHSFNGNIDVFVSKLDPTGSTLLYSTFIGGQREHRGFGIGLDSEGNIYVGGMTDSENFPVTPDALSITSGGNDGFIVKLSPDGTELLYGTYVGGPASGERLTAIEVVEDGTVWAVGATGSWDFPVTPGAFDETFEGGVDGFDGFIVKIDPKLSGRASLVLGTFFGGFGLASGHVPNASNRWLNAFEIVEDIALDRAGNVHVVGTTMVSDDFPLSANAPDHEIVGSPNEAFAAKLNPSLSELIFSTYLGGSGAERARATSVDTDGNMYVAGGTESRDYPVTPGVYQRKNLDEVYRGIEGFLTKLSPDGQIVYSTYVGGASHDWLNQVSVGSQQSPVVAGVAGNVEGHYMCPLVLQFDSLGASLVSSLTLCGEPLDRIAGMTMDESGQRVFITGRTRNPTFPASPFAFQKVLKGIEDAFVAAVDLVISDELTLESVLPRRGGNAGTATVAIRGERLQADTVVTLEGGFPIQGTTLEVNEAGTQLWVRFDLLDETAGLRDVKATNTDGGSAVLPGAFEVEEGGKARLWIDIVGRDPIRGGIEERFALVYGNSGNVDSGAASIYFIISNAQGVQVERRFEALMTPDVPDAEIRAEILSAPIMVNTDYGKLAHLFLPGVPGGFTGHLTFAVYTPSDGSLTKLGLKTWIENAYVTVEENAKNRARLAAFVASGGGGGGGSGVRSEPNALSNLAEVQRAELLARVEDAGTLAPEASLAELISATRSPQLVLSGWNPVSRCGFGLGTGFGFALAGFESPLIPLQAGCLKPLWPENPCLDALFDAVATCLDAMIPGASCIRFGIGMACQAYQTGGGPAPGLGGAFDTGYSGTAGLLGACGPELLKDALGPINSVVGAVKCGYKVFEWGQKCVIPPSGCSGSYFIEGGQVVCKDGKIVYARDPNTKTGNSGVGEARYIRGDQPLRYAVFFENIETATAPAQTVVITDQLDPNIVDLETLTFGPVLFGETILTPDPGRAQIDEIVDLRPEQDLLVHVEASLDPDGMVSWRLTSLDPATQEPTQDPLAGFLPPNVVPPEGDGVVMFTVDLRSEVPDATLIANQGSIVFDFNAPISTPVWLNTIDKSPPTSMVDPLAPSQCADSFAVSWSAQDSGAGVLFYDVFVSVDGGAFEPWLEIEPTTSATFEATPGSTYEFYSVAHDAVGNVELKPPSPEASTTVEDDMIAPSTVVTLTPATNSSGWNNGPVTIDLLATDEGCGVREISYAVSGAQTGEDVVLGDVATVLITAEGTTTLSFFAIDVKGNIEVMQEITVRIDRTPPQVQGLPSSSARIWPPNHKLVEVATLAVTDGLSGVMPDSLLIEVSSNEPINGRGDGNTDPDWLIDGTTVFLRAERAGGGTGRIYTISVRATDLAGNVLVQEAQVLVPHNK